MPPRPEHTVYILANRTRSVLYVGVTNDLPRRMREHRSARACPGPRSGGDDFVHQYNLHALLYTETHADPRDAIVREKRLKRWRREWKLDLIRSVNPTLSDLWTDDVRPW